MLVIMLLMMVMVMVLKMMMMTMLMILVYDLAQDNGALAEPRVGQYPQGIQAWHTGHISPSSSPSSWPASSSSSSSCSWLFLQTMIGSKAPPSILNWVFKYMHCRKVFLTRLIFVFTFVSRSVQMSLYQPNMNEDAARMIFAMRLCFLMLRTFKQTNWNVNPVVLE